MPFRNKLVICADKINNLEDLFLRDTIFVNNEDYYTKLRQLYAMKIELQRLKSLCSLTKSFVIEFSNII